MPVPRRPFIQRIAITLMMAAVSAFALQSIFVAASEAATGDTSHYQLDFAFSHPHGGKHSHVVAHRHADGTAHQHAIDDDDDALAKHLKVPGWNMALVICVLPCPDAAAIARVEGRRLSIEQSRRLAVADPGGLRRPPRPLCIA